VNIVVCIKQVPDTEARITVRQGEADIEREGLTLIVNPYDEYAIEEALKIKEDRGGTVTVLTMGPERATEALRTALAMGADNAVHLCDPAFEGLDPLTAARVMARALQDMDYDLILCGKQAIDDDSCQVGPALAEALGLPQVTVVTSLEVGGDGSKARARREMDGYADIVETPLPAVITAQKGLNEPRFPSLPGIMKAKKKEVRTLSAQDLGLEGADAAAPSTRVVELSVPVRDRAQKLLEDEPPAAAAELARLLSEEAKVL